MDMNFNLFLTDTETAGSIGYPLPYDLSYIIGNPVTGEIFVKRSYVVREIWENENLMASAYYASKRDLYQRDLDNGTRSLRSWAYICKVIRSDMEKHNCHTVGAYNMGFDKRAINNDATYITRGKFKFVFPANTDFICVWRMACTSILRSKWFFRWAEKNNAFTPKGNLSTSAETAYRFIIKQTDFTEEHMGIEDALIEWAILLKILRTRMLYETEPNSACWRIPQKAWQALREG